VTQIYAAIEVLPSRRERSSRERISVPELVALTLFLRRRVIA
jgi:hypothetical protein